MYRKYLTPIALGMTLATISDCTLAEDSDHEVIIIQSTKQDVPLGHVDNSVSVKTGEELEKAGIFAVKDLEKVFPGLVIQTRGNRTYANTTIRGMSSPDYYSPTVSIYVDGILQDSAFLTQQLQNVEQVELLRGPQGTLYGGNAQGGIISIITKKATDQAKASAGVTYSNQSRQLNGSAAIALSDSTYADLVIRSLTDEGNITHVPTNTEKANETKELSGVARLHFIAEDSPLSMTLSVSADDLDSNEEWYLTQTEFDNKKTSQTIPELKRQVNTYSVNIGYDLGNVTLTSITAYQNRDVDRQFIGGDWEEDQNTLSQELLVNTRFNESLSALFGGYFESRQLDVGTESGAKNTIKSDTYAMFGQTTYGVTDTLDLTLGLRASHLSTSSDFDGNPLWMIAGYNEEKSESMLSPKVAIGWQVNEDSRVFASLTSGYRPGGFSPVPRSYGDKDGYDAEKSLNGELGWRTSLVENTLVVSGALYWIETKDIQLYTGVPGSQILNNLGEAKSHGLELELAFYPTTDLTLTLGGTQGKSTFESGNAGLQGNTLPYAPDTTAIAGIEYFLPQSLLDGEVSLITNARYTSSLFFDERNTSSQSGYTLVDFAVNYAFNDKLSFRLFSNNLTDVEYKTYSFSMGGPALSNYGTDREVGLNVKMEW
ncbi:outer membrane receptor protein [Shewanella psychrophila]|uniref:Outer membrane receptor protein n=1 Tax=Shewanella psychrophila TaxID=225848 RepID=A0A1S6HN30_9GAMM|nr:TonB-dependent receptor [Shewanella psychrophila]AQS36927.1 outer membrane receptor protein [Shewanella psychrophila]